MNTDLLKKYAALVIRVGVNLQKDQPLVIHAPITCADFVHALALEGYDAGAYDVAVNWNDEEFAHIRFQKAASERFKEFPAWRKLFYDDHTARGAAFISIAASDPDLYSDIDPKRLTEANQAAGKALMDYRARLMSNKNTWCVVSVPTAAWAHKVFPNCSEAEAVERLWAQILSAVRVSAGGSDCGMADAHCAPAKDHGISQCAGVFGTALSKRIGHGSSHRTAKGTYLDGRCGEVGGGHGICRKSPDRGGIYPAEAGRRERYGRRFEAVALQWQSDQRFHVPFS